MAAVLQALHTGEQVRQPVRDRLDAAAGGICAGVHGGMAACAQHLVFYWSVYGEAVP